MGQAMVDTCSEDFLPPVVTPTPEPTGVQHVTPVVGYTCVSSGDPHFKSFQNEYFDYQARAEVVLYANENIEIQARQQKWIGNANAINSGFALRGEWTCGFTIEFTRGESGGASWRASSMTVISPDDEEMLLEA